MSLKERSRALAEATGKSFDECRTAIIKNRRALNEEAKVDPHLAEVQRDMKVCFGAGCTAPAEDEIVLEEVEEDEAEIEFEDDLEEEDALEEEEAEEEEFEDDLEEDED